MAWNEHRRTRGLCGEWHVPLEIVTARRKGMLRWLELLLRTIALLRRTRPDILFVQNPSLALTVLAAVCRPAFGYRLVVDAHNEGIRPFDRPYPLVRWLTRRLLGAADWTIVSNVALQEDVRDAGGSALVLPDPLPQPPAEGRPAGQPVDVAVIATFRPDEPIDAVLAAAVDLPELRFAISGDPGRRGKSAGDPPANVEFTGFLPDADYWALLRRAHVVCDLTLKSDCLVCGAYEALAVGKPMVLSDNPPTRALFGPAAVLTGSEPASIGSALRSAVDRREELAASAARLRERYASQWARESRQVCETIWQSPGNGRRRHA